MTGLFTTMEQVIESKLAVLINAYLTLFAGKMVTLITIGLPILVAYYGYSILAGRGSSATLGEMFWNVARIGITLSFVENTGGLLDASVSFIHELKSGFVGDDSVFNLLDQQLHIIKAITKGLFANDPSFTKVSASLSTIMIWIGGACIVASAAIVFISAEVILVLLTATAPIFIGCLAFGFLKEIFNGWLRCIFSCIITFIFASMIVKMILDLTSNLFQQLIDSSHGSGLVATGGSVLIIGIIGSSLIYLSSRISGNIAGVAASAAIQGGMTAAAAGAARLSAAASGRGANTVMQGGRNLKSNVSASVANRAKLAEANQKAAIERVKQANLND